ncbi:MAG: hypothetical protein IPK77_09685 [Cellvibrio sp.]|nr:hypothetical protein [Cellvibrio sp.]
MMKLSVKHLSTERDRYLFAWSVSEKKHGIIYHPANVTSLFAELRCIQHLTQNLQCFSRKFLPGPGYQFYTSTQLNEVMTKFKGDPEQFPDSLNRLRYFAYFARICSWMPELPIHKEGITVPSADYLTDPHSTFITIDSDYLLTPYSATTVIGQVNITIHAVDQFINRETFSDKATTVTPLQQVIQRIENPNLKIEVLPDHVLRHKTFAYPDHELPVVLGHEKSDVHFVTLVNQKNKKRYLTTIYMRHPLYTESIFVRPANALPAESINLAPCTFMVK